MEIEHAIQTLEAKKTTEKDIALDNYQKVLEIRERLNGMDSVRVAEILYCIGLVYSNMDDSVKAQEYYQKSLELFRKAYGKEIIPLSKRYPPLHPRKGTLKRSTETSRKAGFVL